MKRLLAALLLMLCFEQVAYAQISLPLDPSLISHTLPPSYLTVLPELGNSRNYRQIKLEEPLLGTDGLSSYTIRVGVIGVDHGGTGAETRQLAVDNLLGLGATGDILVLDGHWIRLPIGPEGQTLTVVNGKPTWSAAKVSIPKTASVITLGESIIDYPNSAQLLTNPGCGINLALTGGHAQLSVDNTVARTNQAQVLAGPISLSNGPIILGGHAQGLNFQGSAHTVNLSVVDPSADRRVIIPDAKIDTELITADGEQYLPGNKIFESLSIKGNTLKVGRNGDIPVTIPIGADELLSKTATQTVSNKAFIGLTIEDSPPYLNFAKSSGSIFISAANPTASRQYQLYDANGDGDIAIKAGQPIAGGICYGDSSLIRFTGQGSAGQPLVSEASGTPSFATLGQIGGGTGMVSYLPGDILYADATGTLHALSAPAQGAILVLGTGKIPKWSISPGAGAIPWFDGNDIQWVPRGVAGQTLTMGKDSKTIKWTTPMYPQFMPE
jgi:hypothetical protein